MKRRHIVLMLLCGVSAITFLDRLALPVAEPGIRNDLHLSSKQWGWILSSYIFANALFEIPSGARGDRHGQRRELTRIAIWWSAFTALTAWCRNVAQIAGARFFFGVGAAGAYPNVAGVVSHWFPRTEHARAQGFIWAAGRFGGALAPLLLIPFSRAFGWRAIFWLLGAGGLLFASLWWYLFRDTPQNFLNISQEELIEIGTATITTPELDVINFQATTNTIPWRSLLGLRHLWLLTSAYFFYAWGSWFYFGWFTTWLTRGAGFTLTQTGLFASLPFAVGIAGNLIGGSLSELLVLRWGRRLAYRLVTSVCLVASSILLLAMTIIQSHMAIIVLATGGFGIMDLMLPSAWAMSMSLGGRFGGTSSAIMNTAGNIGGWFCTVAFGYIVEATGNYNFPLRAIAAAVLLGAVFFSGVDCTRGIERNHLEV